VVCPVLSCPVPPPPHNKKAIGPSQPVLPTCRAGRRWFVKSEFVGLKLDGSVRLLKLASACSGLAQLSLALASFLASGSQAGAASWNEDYRFPRCGPIV
jgi:hypothetical protein